MAGYRGWCFCKMKDGRMVLLPNLSSCRGYFFEHKEDVVPYGCAHVDDLYNVSLSFFTECIPAEDLQRATHDYKSGKFVHIWEEDIREKALASLGIAEGRWLSKNHFTTREMPKTCIGCESGNPDECVKCHEDKMDWVKFYT